MPVPSFTATRWAWLREGEPDVAAAARAVRLPHDFLTERLSGRGATDRGDASGTAWWSTRDERYSDDRAMVISAWRRSWPWFQRRKTCWMSTPSTAMMPVEIRSGTTQLIRS